jgi:putative nucleotidyltransferase with HDIG domain
MPLLALVAATGTLSWPLLACLAVVTGLLGAHLNTLVTRRELRAWGSRLLRRTERLFSGTPGGTEDPVEAFEPSLGELERHLDWMVERQLQHERDMIISVISSLISALEARDPCTRDHSSKVAHLAVQLGREMGLSHERLYEIHLGGLLHDVGKIGIPDAILLKPAGLTRAEYEVMKSHAVLGARILAGIPGLRAVADIILSHHEMFDGGGYPTGIAGRDIPLGSRIIAVSDTYLSLTESRPYRNGQPQTKAMKEIRRVAGRQLDPDVVDALLTILERENRVIPGRFTVPGMEEEQRLAS